MFQEFDSSPFKLLNELKVPECTLRVVRRLLHLVSPLLQRRQHSVQDEELAGGLHQLLVDLRKVV